MLDLKFSRQSRKFLNKLNSKDWNSVVSRIELLRKDPFPKGFRRVEGKKDRTFRVRIGEYRVLYLVFKDRNLLFISIIDKRPSVYDK